MSGQETFIVLESLVVFGCAVITVIAVLIHTDSIDKNRRKYANN